MTKKMADSVLYFKSTTEDKMSDYEVNSMSLPDLPQWRPILEI